MLANGLFGETVKPSGGNIGVELLIPDLRVKCQEPFAKPGQFLWGQIRDRFFKFLKCHDQMIPHAFVSCDKFRPPKRLERPPSPVPKDLTLELRFRNGNAVSTNRQPCAKDRSGNTPVGQTALYERLPFMIFDAEIDKGRFAGLPVQCRNSIVVSNSNGFCAVTVASTCYVSAWQTPESALALSPPSKPSPSTKCSASFGVWLQPWNSYPAAAM